LQFLSQTSLLIWAAAAMEVAVTGAAAVPMAEAAPMAVAADRAGSINNNLPEVWYFREVFFLR
jgi:hypothetical protein